MPLHGRIAVVSLTKKGTELARRLHEGLRGSHFYFPKKFARGGEAPPLFPYEGSVKSVAEAAWSAYDSILLLVPIGAVIRVIAPLLKDKSVDPAIITGDGQGAFLISALSGHLGGANELTRLAAAIIGATPVVTTASDMSQTIPVDILGREFGWRVEWDHGKLVRVAAAVVNEEKVSFYQECAERNWWPHDKPLPANIAVCRSLEEFLAADCAAALYVTYRATPDLPPEFLAKSAIYRPRVLDVGLVPDEGMNATALERGLRALFEEGGLSFQCIRKVAVPAPRAGEESLAEFTRQTGIPLEGVPGEDPSALARESSASGKLVLGETQGPRFRAAVAEVRFEGPAPRP
ncbi:MAG: cobalt-precorrin 5A hydrolase [Nitrospinota bacterium]